MYFLSRELSVLGSHMNGPAKPPSFTDGFLHLAPRTACSHCSKCRCFMSSYEQTVFHCTCELHCASLLLPTEGGLTHRFHCRATMNGRFMTIHIREEKGREKFPPQRAHRCARCGMDWSSHSPQHRMVETMGSHDGHPGVAGGTRSPNRKHFLLSHPFL